MHLINQPSRTEMSRFIEQLRLLVRDEAATARQRTHQTWAKPIRTRVAEGRAIEGVRIVAITPKGIRLQCGRNSSRFREGDVLLLNRGNPFLESEPSFTVTLEEDDDTRLLVSSQDLDVNWGFLLRERSGWVLDEGLLDLSQYALDALAEAGDTVIGRERIVPLLMGYARPTMDMTCYQRGLSIAETAKPKLNWSQSEALAQAYATDLTYLIQGPPGTGKTHVLAYLAQALVEDGERVLVTAFTHRAINNTLNTLVEKAPGVPAIKIGQHSRADDLAAENYATFDASPVAELSDGYVIGATPFATRTKRLSGVEFETVIFDEASQITLPLAVMGMLAAKKYIFIGDHNQLPPVLATRHRGGLLDESVFGALIGRGFDQMLNETYRLNAELAAWPSKQFYNDELKPANDKIARARMTYSQNPSRLAHILDPDEPKVFLDLLRRNTMTRSHYEASAVVDIVATLLECGVPAKEIGIIAPYRAQGREVRNLLRKTVPDADTRKTIVTDTVERMQGQERDVIIVSLTTSNPAYAAGLAEFFFQPQRLNVTITRPRKKLIVVGSSHVLNAEPEEEELQEAVALLRDFLNTCAYRTLRY